MGPICICPKLKDKGYGKMLLDYTVKKAAEYGLGALCFEGDIGFYGKSGFTYAVRYGIRYPGKCYLVDETATDEFDKTFPYKEKSAISGQLF